MGCCSNRTEFRVCPVGAPPWMGFIACLNLGNLLFGFTVYNHNLISHVGCHQDIPLAGIPSAVMEKSLCLYLCNLQILYIGIVNSPYVACLFNIDYPLRLFMR